MAPARTVIGPSTRIVAGKRSSINDVASFLANCRESQVLPRFLTVVVEGDVIVGRRTKMEDFIANLELLDSKLVFPRFRARFRYSPPTGKTLQSFKLFKPRRF
jgi:hypothetical protein